MHTITPVAVPERHRDRLTLGILYAILYTLDNSGEDSVSWFREGMSFEEMYDNFMSDPATRDERYKLLLCTTQHVT